MSDASQETSGPLVSRRALLKAAAGFGIAIPASALLAACGDDDDDDSGSQAGSAPTSANEAPAENTLASGGEATEASTEAPAEEPSARGGTLKVALTGDPPNLDLHQTADSIVLLVTGHIYETLFTYDEEFKTIPMLAESYEVSDDGLLVTVELRQGVPFHNGEVMTATDVSASIERWSRIVGLGEGLTEATDEMVQVDDHTIEFHLNRPFGTFTVALARALQGCAIYPKSVLDQSDDTSLAEFIGTGPYKFVEWQPDRFVRVERFDDYAALPGDPQGYGGNKAALLDEIQFIPVPNEASRIAGLQSGDYHYLETISTDHYVTLKDDDSVAVDLLEPDSWLNIVLNLRSPITENPDVRQAIQLALNHEEIMQAAFGDGFFELTPTLLPGAEAWYSEAGVEFFNRNDPDEAKSVLEASGYNGEQLRIMCTQEIQQEYNGTVLLKQQLEAVGFTIDLQVYDGATLSDRRDDETLWEMYTAWASFRPDPILRNLTCSATGWWCTEEKDELLADLASESDFEVRYEIWEQVQQTFYEEVPRLKIGDSRRIVARSPQLNGLSASTNLQPEFSNAWLEE